MNIYVLLLEDDRIYVGKTANLNRRMKEHLDGHGSAWTTMYKPIKLLYAVDGDSEDYHVIRMMERYGVHNVRGGSFSRITMTAEDIRMAERLLQTFSDKCYNCGKSGHYIKHCPSKSSTKPASKTLSASNTTVTTRSICQRCGRNNHTIECCYAKTNLEGFMIVDSHDDFKYCDSEYKITPIVFNTSLSVECCIQ